VWLLPFLPAFKSLFSKLGGLARKAATLEEELDRLLLEATLLKEQLAAIVSDPSDLRSGRRRMTKHAGGAIQTLARLAHEGVAKIKIRRFARTAELTIGDHPPARLSTMLAYLVEAICLDIGHSDDDLIGYKSLAEITLFLEKRCNKRLTRHGVTQHIHRLRRVLQMNGNNPYLIQTTRNGGARFALKKGATVVISDDHT
jgi:hypothetical protein